MGLWGRMGPHGAAWGRMGLAWGRMGPHGNYRMGLAWGRMGLAWGWHGVGMGLAWGGWHGAGMGLAWGEHGAAWSAPKSKITFPHGACPSPNPPKKQAGGRRAHWSGSVYVMWAVL